MTKIHFAFGVGLILTTALVQAKDYQGSFVDDSGFSQVEIHKSKFNATGISGAGNLCDVKGVYKSGIVRAADQCEFKLIPLANGGFKINLPDQSSCDNYCGANISIRGEYKPVPPACEMKHFAQSLTTYRKQYKQQQYETAYQTFSKTVSSCKPYVDFLTYDQAASELSLSLKKLGRAQDCKALLSKTKAYGKSEAQLKDDYLPVMFDSYIGTAKTIWFNAKACENAQ